MSRFFQALLTGMFFTFILDFLFLLAVQLHYLDRYGIKEFYNVLFAEHQDLLYLLPPVLILGFVLIYLDNLKIALFTLILAFAPIVAGLLLSDVGEYYGRILLQKENVRYSDGRFVYQGTLYYEGRKQVTLFDDELQRLITLEKKDLKP